MKRTTLAYCLVMVLGVALVAVGLLDIRAQFLPTAVSEILAPLGGLAIGLGIAAFNVLLTGVFTLWLRRRM